MPSLDDTPAEREQPPCRVAIIGAGFGGIGMAIRLRQSGEHDFLLIEQADTVGGTWRDNTYPGCTCDIPSHLYSLSFAPNAEWSRRYPSQAEIRRYLEDCVGRFGLTPNLRLGLTLRTALFDATNHSWRLEFDTGLTVTADVLVVAVGALRRPAIPDIPGLADFRGPMFHSARWDHTAELVGKRVAVIGTGASAVQLVPRIAPQVASLTLFQRTPPWLLPKHDPPIGAWQRRALRHVPLLRRAHRAWLYWTHEQRAIGFVRFPRLMQVAERRARSYAKRVLGDDPVREAVTPEYRIGCKRVLLSNDFLQCLTRPNVEVATAPIVRILPDGVVTSDGAFHATDLLVLATGFQATDPLGDVRIVGRDGVTLADAWRDGMCARLGLALPRFPNMFLLGGPNTGLGHNSVVFMLEAQIRHVLRCLRWMRRRGAATIEVRADAQARFTRRLQRWMQRTVWVTGCRSWYLDAAGNNTTLWPGFSIGYWLRTRRVSKRDYQLAEVKAAGNG